MSFIMQWGDRLSPLEQTQLLEIMKNEPVRYPKELLQATEKGLVLWLLESKGLIDRFDGMYLAKWERIRHDGPIDVAFPT